MKVSISSLELLDISSIKDLEYWKILIDNGSASCLLSFPRTREIEEARKPKKGNK